MSNSEIDRRRRRAESVRGGVERRTFSDHAGLELRSDSDGRLRVSGVAATFDVLYDVGSYKEKVAPTALNRTLGDRPDVVFNVDHGQSLSGLPLARTRSSKGGPGTLQLSADDYGLHFDASMDAEDPDAQALARAIRNGTMSQCSFAFRVNRDEWDPNMETRTLLDINLAGGDVSCVAFPANPSTSISVRRRVTPVGLDLRSLANRERERLFMLGAGRSLPARPTSRSSDYYGDRLAEIRAENAKDGARLAALLADRPSTKNR